MCSDQDVCLQDHREQAQGGSEVQQVIDAPAVACILLNWNGWRDTVACLRRLTESDYPNLSIIVVDNHSTDDSVERLRQAYPAQEVIESGANLGFGSGNNLGMREALRRGAQFIWLLNTDTLVQPNTLSLLVDWARSHPEAGQIGSVLSYIHDPARVQSWGGGQVNLWTGRVTHFQAPPPSERMQYITAASVLMPRSALEQVGFFDENFFMYFEDTDLSFRMRQAGKHLTVCPNANILHQEGASARDDSAKFDGMVSASAIRFFRKHAPFPIVPLLIFLGGRALKRLISGKPRASKAILGAWLQICRLH